MSVRRDLMGYTMKGKRKKNNDTQRVFLAKEIAEIIINRYPSLSLYEVKSAMMSAEQFVMDSMYRHHKDDTKDRK